jgi:MFS family permease
MAAGNASAAADSESRTTSKLRRRLIPLLFLLYVVAYLDRINIGFAALTMNTALAITSAQFGLLLGIFFWGYFVFEIPSNLLLHKIGARIWIARILISWGIVAMLTGAVHSVPQLYVVRFLLGVAEAGFFPGIVLYLTYWFRQREQAHVISLFMTALPVASILGAPVSGFILDHAHWAAISSWRWLLILEGLPAIVCGVLTYFLLPSRPAEATFLTQDEKSWLTAELAREEQEKTGEHSISALRALAHPRVWHLASVLFTFDIGLYVLYASSGEITFERLLQHSSGHPGDGSSPRRVNGDDPCLPKFRPQAGTAIPRGNSCHRWRHGTDDVGSNELPPTLDHALVVCSDGNVQLLRPVLLDSEQVPSGIFRSLRHRPNQLCRESGRVCRAIGHRGPCQRGEGNLRRPRPCRCFVIRVSDAGTAPARKKYH